MSIKKAVRALHGSLVALMFLGTWSHREGLAQTTFHVNGSCGDDSWSGLSPKCQAPDGPKRTIQAAMNLAQGGDVVLVADGIYTGSGNKWLFFPDQEFTLRSASGPEGCVIDLQRSGVAFFLVADEGPLAVIEGFTVKNGSGSSGGAAFLHHDADATFVNCVFTGNSSSRGGAIYAETTASATFIDCVIRGNTALYGGGVCLSDASDPTFLNCDISANVASIDGGGVFVQTFGTTPRLVNCTVTGNSAGGAGGGIFVAAGPATITNCTIADNVAAGRGGGFACQGPSTPTITNCILWDDGAPIGSEIALLDDPNLGGTTLTLRFSDFEGGAAAVLVDPGSTLNLGAGNLDVDPRFVDSAASNYQLSPSSPCIDAGNNADVPAEAANDPLGTPRILDGDSDGNAVVDMGAFERFFCQQDLGFGGPGDSVLSVCGEELLSGNNAELRLANALPLHQVFLIAGLSSNPTAFGGGVLVPIPILLLFPLATGGDGELSFNVSGGHGPLTIYLQFVYQDPQLPGGFGISNALAVQLLP